MARTADEYIGRDFGGGKVGRLDYDWSFERMPFYNWITSSWTAWGFGYQDATDFGVYTINGAWGAWHNTPTIINLYSTVLSAGNYASTVYAQTGWAWNDLDGGLLNGSEVLSGATVDERLERWNEILDLIDSTASWVWGNVRDGGVGFFRYDSNSVFNFATYGLYKNDEGDEKIVATVSNIVRGYDYYNADGVFTTFNHNRASTSNCIYFTRNVPGTSIYACTDPELGGAFGIDLWNVVWSGHNSSLADVLYADRMEMSIDGQSQIVPSILISMGSIGSPYNGYHQDLYYPEYLDYDMGDWLLVSQDDGISESLSLGGDDDPSGDNIGDFDNSSYDISETDLGRFTVDAQDCGFVTVYKVPKETLKSFGSWLFSSHPQDFWDWIDEIKKIWDNPMDCIMSLNLSAYNANTGGERDISFFGKASGYKAPIVDGLTQIFECGDLVTENGDGKLHEYSGNFLDYGAKSTIKIFLPYCGTFSLATNEVMGAKLHLQYVIDLLTGACVAELTVHRDRGYVSEDPSLDSVLYRFNGNIFQQIPIGASNYGNILTGQLGIISSAMSAVTGNVIGAVAGAVNSTLGMSPQVERVGNCGSSYGYMSTQKPFIIQEYPWYNWNNKYDEYYGRPLYQFKVIGECDGYTEIDTDTLWTNYQGITEEEEEMLKSIINSGGIYMERNTAYTNYNP